ncbi:hypothetical protein ACFL6U_15180 [Planctomycetota bacterium]
MTDQLRVWKVLLVLLISMTCGAIILMGLGNNPPSAGAFSLASYYKLDPPDAAVSACKTPILHGWQRIEITFSRTQGGDIEYLSSLEGLQNPSQLNAHFVVCNGVKGDDGLIQPTQRWKLQQPTRPQRNWGLQNQTISICVVADTPSTPATDCQMRRVSALVQTLSRKFRIDSESISWPGDLAGR